MKTFKSITCQNVDCLKVFQVFKPSNFNRKFCSLGCSTKINGKQKSHKHTIVKTCKQCHIEFSRILSYANQEFCSAKCRNTFVKTINLIEKQCLRCQKKFLTDSKRNNKKHCSRRCAAKNSWNLGQTIETNEKLAKIGQVNSLKLSRKILDGTLIAHSSGKRSQHFSLKSSKIIKCRSRWERAYCYFLDKNPNVISYSYESTAIPYYSNEHKRMYMPDFLVAFNDQSKQLIEIKPHALVKNQINDLKFQAAQAFCDKNHIEFAVITEKSFDFKKIIDEFGIE